MIIIGAGTGGLCLAQGPRQAGVSVAVYERDRTRADGLFGYRVGIDPDGSRALAACLPADLFEVFVATKAVTPRFFNIVTERRSELLRMGDVPDDVERQPDAVAEVHAAFEQAVARTGMRWTFLRPNEFAGNSLQWAPQIKAGDIVRAPYPLACTARSTSGTSSPSRCVLSPRTGITGRSMP
ncbi:hypothetical protein ACSDR0_21120 [Streptosporangium sp. G11]|uniref:hypothetical protein n=1 Tax=Streptosporangium sp. G11 TaxID=3436926 RepID=UPI003EB7C598